MSRCVVHASAAGHRDRGCKQGRCRWPMDSGHRTAPDSPCRSGKCPAPPAKERRSGCTAANRAGCVRRSWSTQFPLWDQRKGKRFRVSTQNRPRAPADAGRLQPFSSTLCDKGYRSPGKRPHRLPPGTVVYKQGICCLYIVPFVASIWCNYCYYTAKHC